ncbi:MAG: fibronectin type III domain-containing protein, partial [Bacteroidales bacterium]|nr:fibronectin type III domain-containing protein [Bacteroidales bacterium]
MKTKLFLLFFVCISFITHGQTMVTTSVKKYNTAICGGVNNGLYADGTTFIRQNVKWDLGYLASGFGRGRGYIEFNLEDIPSYATITAADLKFQIGSVKTNNESFVVRNLPNPSNCNGSSAEFLDYGVGTSISTISSVNTLNIKTLSIITQVSDKKGNKLYIGLVHGAETNTSKGITIDEIELAITYTVTQPNAPANLQASNVNTSGCTLSWSEPTGPSTQYRVYDGSALIKTVTAPATGTTITGLNPSTQYSFCVKAYNTAGESTCSNTVTFTTPVPPIAITAPDIVYYTGASITLNNAPAGTVTWTLPGSGAFSFSPTSYLASKTGNPVTVYRVGSSSSNGQLTASIGGSTVATKTLTPCAAAALEDYGAGSTVY